MHKLYISLLLGLSTLFEKITFRIFIFVSYQVCNHNYVDTLFNTAKKEQILTRLDPKFDLQKPFFKKNL